MAISSFFRRSVPQTREYDWLQELTVRQHIVRIAITNHMNKTQCYGQGRHRRDL